MHTVYILKSLKDDGYYIGVTNNISRRLKEHNSGLSRSTKARKPFTLIYEEKYENINNAYSREKYLKSLKNRKKIEKIINI